MTCEKVRTELAACAPGDLPAGVETHLATCAACAEEAAAMKDLGYKLKQGLAEWVDQGSIPHDLALRIDAGIRGQAGPAATRWRWQAYAGVMAAAAAVFLLVLGMRPMLATPDLEVRLEGAPVESIAKQKMERSVTINQSAERNGITLTVQKVEVSGIATHVQYAVSGIALDKSAPNQYLPQLTGEGGPVRLQSFTATQQKNEIIFHAYFAPVSGGTSVTLSVETLNGVKGPWQVSFQS